MGLISPTLSNPRMAQFCEQLAAFTKAGIPPVRILHLLATESPRPEIRELARHVKPRIEAGETLSAALRAEGRCLPVLFKGMVDIGERTGTLPRTFAQMAEYYERMAEVFRLLIRQITYPLCILFAMWVAIPLLVVTVSSAVLGKTEGLAMAILRLLIWNCAVPLLAFALMVAAILRVPVLRRCWVALVLAVWPFSRIYRRLSLARFAWAMGLLQQTDIPLHHQLRAAATTFAHPKLAAPFLRAAARVEAGETLSQALQEAPLLDGNPREYLAHGETAGRLAGAFESIANDQFDSAYHAIKCILYPLEGALIVLIGIYIVLGGAAML